MVQKYIFFSQYKSSESFFKKKTETRALKSIFFDKLIRPETTVSPSFLRCLFMGERTTSGLIYRLQPTPILPLRCRTTYILSSRRVHDICVR